MARSAYVWGIDIGKCALKALRCRISADPRKLEAVACEYIEYPMILTQPEADPVELVQSALEQLLSRHDLKGDTVAVSVPGNLGLSSRSCGAGSDSRPGWRPRGSCSTRRWPCSR
jgi:type IV pilus assembly protein PilM